MDKKLKKRWLEALRSGDYAKGEGALCKISRDPAAAEAAYCCLGVLYEIVNGEDAWVMPRHDYLSLCHLKTRRGDTGTYGTRLLGEHITHLISINDSSATFKPVIEYIESNL